MLLDLNSLNPLNFLNLQTGSLQVSLKHEPDKTDAAPGATGGMDVGVAFDVTIE